MPQPNISSPMWVRVCVSLESAASFGTLGWGVLAKPWLCVSPTCCFAGPTQLNTWPLLASEAHLQGGTGLLGGAQGDFWRERDEDKTARIGVTKERSKERKRLMLHKSAVGEWAGAKGWDLFCVNIFFFWRAKSGCSQKIQIKTKLCTVH